MKKKDKTIYNYILKVAGIEISPVLEHLILNPTKIATLNNVALGIGAYNPNDEELEQAVFYTGKDKGCIQYPPAFDETRFVRYIVSSASESSGGFEFKLLDYSYPEIVFNVAWIKNDNYDKGTYEDALDFWLT